MKFRGQEEIALTIDPRNEFVLCKTNQGWEVIGPVTCDRANAYVKILQRLKVDCFICIEDEFNEKGLPTDESATSYFGESGLYELFELR